MSRSVKERPTAWWLLTLRRRAEAIRDEKLVWSGPMPYRDPILRAAAVKFFNAAIRAEQSGLTQAHQLADQVRTWDPELAEVLRLYGEEEGWHQSLLEDFLRYLGGSVQPMGKVTRLLFRAYARAERMDTIVLSNLMFETIGSTTYRLALQRVEHPEVRKMLTILTRDESFHVPLNVFFLRRVLSRAGPKHDLLRLQWMHRLLFFVLVALPIASRPKSRVFDQLGVFELMRAYATQLAALFVEEPDIPLSPPWFLLGCLGVRRADVMCSSGSTRVSAAEAAAHRTH